MAGKPFICRTTSETCDTGTQGGVWAYLWNDKPPAGAPVSPGMPTNNWTPLISGGSTTPNVTLGGDGNYEVTVPLTDATTPQVSGARLYLLLQSEDPSPSAHHDLPTLIGGTRGQIIPNAKDWNFGFSYIEFTLSSQSGGTGDISGIDGFGQHLALAVAVGTPQQNSRGYAISAAQMTTDLTDLASAALTYPKAPLGTTPYSPLDGTTSMVISPSNGPFGAQYYPTTAWHEYLSHLATLAARNTIRTTSNR